MSSPKAEVRNSRRVVIIGAGGRLGAALLRVYTGRFQTTGFNHAQLDLADLECVRETLSSLSFDVLINCAAQTNVDRCETHHDEAFRLNAEAPELLAEICRDKNARLIHVSTDYVFDGHATRPYTEDDAANPISVYGESKREGERRVLAVDDQNLVLRVSWVFGPDRPSFIDHLLRQARENESVAAVADKFSTPTYTRDIAEMLPLLFGRSSAAGLLHFASEGQCSWREYTQWALECCHSLGVPMRAKKVETLSLADMKNFVARRPINTVLATEKYQRLTGEKPRHWRDAVAEYVREFYSV